jgi:acetyltransferase-like isoleucine patch superfamily enzyme
MHPLIIAGLLETGIYFLAAFAVALLYHGLPVGESVPWTALFVYLAYHLGGITLIAGTGLVVRALPKPSAGTVTIGRDLSLLDEDAWWWLVLLSLSTIPYRTPGRWAASIWPFPAQLYFGVAGAEIHPTAAVPPHVVILDPWLVKVGARTVLGDGAKLSPHSIRRPGELLVGPITIGDDVVLGGDVVVGPDVEIGDGAVVATRSAVLPGTRIPAGETWAGSPARRVKRR